MSKLNAKLLLIIAVIGISIALFYPYGTEPNGDKTTWEDNIKLGLDLRGGFHLRLRVLTDKAIETQTNLSIAQMKGLLAEKSIETEKIFRSEYNQFKIEGAKLEKRDTIKDIISRNFKDWNHTAFGDRFTVTLKPNIEMQLKEQTLAQTKETISNRIDEFGVAETVVQAEGKDRILVQIPGISEKEEERVMAVIQSTAVLELRQAVSNYIPAETRAEAMEIYGKPLTEDVVMLETSPQNKEEDGYYVLKAAPVVLGRDIKRTYRAQDRYGYPAVGFSLTSRGARSLGRHSEKVVKEYAENDPLRRLAIVLDNRVISAPGINTTLSYDNIIQGKFTNQQVQDMLLVLRSGSLKAPMVLMEQRIIGPSLGADSIRKGIIAALFGLLLVICFMLVYYKMAGINSVIALVLNIIILMGALAYFEATLTVPGIAGIILTIGMSVDANVLIFERIKEELAAGKSPKSAIDSGFKKAFLTIMDANITTVIAAIFLFQFGTGPIKGFSVTLIIGILASMFTAIFVSRVIFDLIYARKKGLKTISI